MWDFPEAASVPSSRAIAGEANDPSSWLSLGPASRFVGVDPDTLRRWADDGLLKA
jgi:hypothetical protein